MLLSRVADKLFWGARYLERADGTARLVRSFTEVIIDLPVGLTTSWAPLLAVAGGREAFDVTHARDDESAIVRSLVADASDPSSVVGSVAAARENLRTTREVLPREAWQAVNDLHLYASSNVGGGVDRRSRARFLSRVMGECQRVDGVLSACMSRDEAYELWRLGQAIERADMSTRVLGVRAAALLAGGSGDHDAVQWMGVLRSVSALQMYQRSHRGPIDGAGIVRFLLYDERFPRSVAGCAKRMRSALERLPHTSRTTPALDALDAELARAGELTARSDGAVASGEALDEAMDRVQVALAAVSGRITSTFVAAVRAADDTAVGTVAVTEVGAEASR